MSDYKDEPTYGDGQHLYEGPLGKITRAAKTAGTFLGVSIATGNPIIGGIVAIAHNCEQIKKKVNDQVLDKMLHEKNKQRGS